MSGQGGAHDCTPILGFQLTEPDQKACSKVAWFRDTPVPLLLSVSCFPWNSVPTAKLIHTLTLDSSLAYMSH